MPAKKWGRHEFGVTFSNVYTIESDQKPWIERTSIIELLQSTGLVAVVHTQIITYNFKECYPSNISSGNDNRPGVKSMLYIGNIITYFMISHSSPSGS